MRSLLPSRQRLLMRSLPHILRKKRPKLKNTLPSSRIDWDVLCQAARRSKEVD